LAVSRRGQLKYSYIDTHTKHNKMKPSIHLKEFWFSFYNVTKFHNPKIVQGKINTLQRWEDIKLSRFYINTKSNVMKIIIGYFWKEYEFFKK
jgi:hypothetical protein